jgi:hypothetical protein
VLAKRTDEVLGELVALIHISANFADIAFFLGRLRLGLDVILIVGVGHGFFLGDDSCFGDSADEHAVCVKVNVLLYLQGHEGVDIAGKEYHAVVSAQGSAVLEFVDLASAAEAECLKYLKGSFYR